MNSVTLESKGLNSFTNLSDGNLEQVDGGVIPLIIGGVAISKAAIGWGALAIGGGIGIGYWINR
ncbi:bacteriocin [Xylocopilactobacillus apicola]|uniref:Class IIb bacteriocin, lactobin A/cerein 7B family n=1 Tax=Xylocopilactobacillus apicola TaxID=2932184 RepID=A0AAU9DRE5_9LACO|nr:bacteriocin [Xylocopilactobacillus apicola]BDR57743.1 hypothetical protein XA3_01840 [Xylocopilactobacillus apicola]BDR57746.1 hypothetical protein XA3_01870 [Xylocopilactobacillus apicola]